MRRYEVSGNSVVLMLTKAEAASVARAVTPLSGTEFCSSLVDGAVTRAIRNKLKDALEEIGQNLDAYFPPVHEEKNT